MARMRTLKPEAASSESLARVAREVRWTFGMLWTHCDDEGRAVWNTRLIKSAIYPLDDDMTPEAVHDDLEALLGVGALCRYTVDGKTLLHVPSWHDHQHPNRKVASKLPACPKQTHGSEQDVSDNGGLIPVVVGEGRGDGGGGAAPSAAIHPPKSMFCPEHPNGTEQPCRPCKQARIVWDAWEKQPKPKQPKTRPRCPFHPDEYTDTGIGCVRCELEQSQAVRPAVPVSQLWKQVTS